METNFNGLPNQDDSGGQNLNPIPGTETASTENADGLQEGQRQRHRHHEEHHINRKYRMFSNHSSANDMPHTNTSF